MKKIVIIVAAGIVLLLMAIPLYTYFAPVTVKGEVTVKIPSHSNSAQIGTLLKENGVIRSEAAFKVYLKLSGAGTDLKAGQYTFAGKYTMKQVCAELTAGGESVGARITIPEGYNLAQIAAVLVEAGICSAEDFNEAVLNGDYNYDYLPAKGTPERLEGFLFPETYQFDESVAVEEVLKTMLAEFDAKLTEAWQAQLAATGKSVYDWVTMASIVEKEAVVEEDRPIIAGVFYRRLEQDMLLQSCATVQYALGEVKPVLSNEDVMVDSPYNTYRNNGLPPGPIACPGYDSLEAALYPAATDNLFFVAKPNGAHIFTKTYEEHLAAKQDIENGKYDDE